MTRFSRAPAIRAGFDALRPGEICVDNFAGGGGASEGVARALGRPIDIAINHSPEAIAMHKVNHPETKHYCEDVYKVDPKEVASGRPVGFAWFSPDCTHFSKAKGSKPRSRRVRGLAWVVVRWAREVRPRIIVLENVEEFEDWGPLLPDGLPDPKRLGKTFRAWVSKLRKYGYEVDWRLLVAADYGAPTIRKRLFLIARCDGQPIIWPEPTHGQRRAHPWRSAAEVIDWSIPCRSIFGRKRPLKPATLARIHRGIRRYVLDTADPFIIPVAHQGDERAHSVREPLRTITGSHRGEFAVVEPFIVRHGHYSTKTGAGLVEGRGAGIFRGQPLGIPLSTICATNDKHLVCPVVIKHYAGNGCADVEMRKPLGTITSKDHHALAAAWLTKLYGSCKDGVDVRAPLPTITSGGRRGGGHLAEVRAFLVKYYGNGGKPDSQQQSLFDPLHTITRKARFGLVTIRGEEYRIVDIGMRMLQPPELYRGNGFPDDYVIDFEFNGKPVTKTIQIDLCGNSVPPQFAEAVTRANVLGPRAVAA